MPTNVNQQRLDIYLAGPRGFCAGVDRAILMVEKALKNMYSEIERDMKLMGVKRISELSKKNIKFR